jgi:peptidoglycan/xylan/chitin deacetylase (PgdA/CDA1 family)
MKSYLNDLIVQGKKLFNKLTKYDDSLIILMYHSITDAQDKSDAMGRTVSRDLFKQQLMLIKSNGYNILSLEKAVKNIQDNKIEPKSLCVTFDDGYEDNYHNAFPVLYELGIPATIFLISSYIKNNENFQHLSEKGIYEKSMNLSQIKEMLSHEDIITFGSHTHSHKRLSSLTLEEAELELEKGISELKKEGISTTLFAYPYGGIPEQNDDYINILQKNGISAAVTTTSGYNKVKQDLFKLKRIHISQSDVDNKLLEKLLGVYDLKLRINRIIKTVFK